MSKSSQSLLASLASRRLAQLRMAKAQETLASVTSPGALDLLDFIPTMNPRLVRPTHLTAIAEIFAKAETEEVRYLVSVPPQHGKTKLLTNGLARAIRRRPWINNAYASYGDTVARKKSLDCRDIAVAAGVDLRRDANAINDWQTTEGGGLISVGVGGPLTGNPVNGMLIIDDPHKDRAEAESALAREKLHEWLTSVAMTRVHPGAGIIVCHTRWHPDDLIGRLEKETKILDDGREVPVWTKINLPAIDAEGEALWPEGRPLSFLRQHQANPYDWASLWMGDPRPRGDSIFRGMVFYTTLPDRFRVGGGCDLAYTAKTRADSSCAIVLLQSGTNEKGQPLYFVVEVERAQVEAPQFVQTLKRLQDKHPIRSWHWFCSTTEKGVAQVINDARVVHIESVLATVDKYQRATPVAQAWNEGRILVPKDAPWLKSFVDELAAFTGVGDRHDDQVDALASAYASFGNATAIPAPPPPRPSRWGTSPRGF